MNLASRLILASNWLYIAGLAPGSERNSSKLKLLQRSISLLMWYFASASYDLLRMFSLSNWSERLVNFSASSFNSWKAWSTLPKIPLVSMLSILALIFSAFWSCWLASLRMFKLWVNSSLLTSRKSCISSAITLHFLIAACFLLFFTSLTFLHGFLFELIECLLLLVQFVKLSGNDGPINQKAASLKEVFGSWSVRCRGFQQALRRKLKVVHGLVVGLTKCIPPAGKIGLNLFFLVLKQDSKIILQLLKQRLRFLDLLQR
ncbi:hypothetical protein LDBUL1519_00584 [Lactobacillus delbrueckii subsp. bulgaricus CNCM I-1519]|nr:hypothetical protein LDBUL1519_00584 [Lactobacillus delbrueckii subsp. bulgaricus CNCM I-1519]